jgi:hypothetical protein
MQLSLYLVRKKVIEQGAVVWLHAFLTAALNENSNLLLATINLPLEERAHVIYPFDRRCDGLQSPSGCCGEGKNYLLLPGIEPRFSIDQPAT